MGFSFHHRHICSLSFHTGAGKGAKQRKCHFNRVLYTEQGRWLPPVGT